VLSKFKKAKQDENGYIVVETVMAFTMLVMVMVVIISLVNIVAVRSKVHHAITQTALDLSKYAYITTWFDDVPPAPTASGLVDQAVNSLSNAVTNMGNSVAGGAAQIFLDDYTALLIRDLFAATGEEGRQQVMEDAVKDVFMLHLSDDLSSGPAGWRNQADEFLRRYNVFCPNSTISGIDGIRFSVPPCAANPLGIVSTMRDSSDDTVVTVSYRIQFNIFNILPLPLFLDVQQTVRTKAWVN
jgi:hypothetical protein